MVIGVGRGERESGWEREKIERERKKALLGNPSGIKPKSRKKVYSVYLLPSWKHMLFGNFSNTYQYCVLISQMLLYKMPLLKVRQVVIGAKLIDIYISFLLEFMCEKELL